MMRVLLPLAGKICAPISPILELGIDTSYDMGRALAAGNIYNWEREVFATLLALCSTLNEPKFLDIGANIGIYSLTVALLYGNSIPVSAVEPIPDLVEKMRGAANINGAAINIIQGVLANSGQESLEFNIAMGDSGSSLLPRGNQLKTKISVKSCALHDIYDRFNLIKIDTEGTELDVLTSGLHDLEHYKPYILIEMLTCDSFNKVKALMEPLGYRFYHLLKDFRLLKLESNPLNRLPREYNYLMAPADLDSKFMDAHRQWVDAIEANRHFRADNFFEEQQKRNLCISYLAHLHHNEADFICFTGASWVALALKGLSKKIHYEYLIRGQKMTINFHSETEDEGFNRSLSEHVKSHLCSNPIISDMRLLEYRSGKTYGFYFEMPYSSNFQDLEDNYRMMNALIRRTLGALLDKCNSSSH